MSNHMVVYVDGLMRPEAENMRPESTDDNAIDIYDGDTTDEELISSAECRICQDECAIKNLESPCACNGSLKVAFLFTVSCGNYSFPGKLRKLTQVLCFDQYAHRKCVQRWCNEKGNTICEICHQVYIHSSLAAYCCNL